MNDYNIEFIDCIWDKTKNLQKINTIEIFYDVIEFNNEWYISINYKFHKIDYLIFMDMIKFHTSNINNFEILKDGVIIESISNDDSIYKNFTLISKEMRLYNNISYIPFLKRGKWNNMNESVTMNTISGEPV